MVLYSLPVLRGYNTLINAGLSSVRRKCTEEEYMNILLILWTVQQASGIQQEAKMALNWMWMCVETEMLRLVRVVGEIRNDQGHIDDGMWAARRTYSLCCVFCIAMSCWSVQQSLCNLHLFFWAIPTLLLVSGFWGYMLTETRSVVDQLQERKKWITGRNWVDCK